MDHEITFILPYMDDLILIENNSDLILGMKTKLKDTFVMIYLGLLHFLLCIPIFNLMMVSSFLSISMLLICWKIGGLALPILVRSQVDHGMCILKD